MQTQAVIRHISRWLADYAVRAGAKGFVVGISGGVDSAVVSALCAHSGLDVLCVVLPIRQQANVGFNAHFRAVRAQRGRYRRRQ